MEAIRLKNFRGFVDTDFVPLKPLTLLVGRNNSGKSSFLRVLPLLKQSVERPTTGPILWFGRYVDFGSFADTVSVGADDISISFTLRPNIEPGGDYLSFLWRSRGRMLEPPPSLEVELVLAGDQETTIARTCMLKFAGQKVSLHCNKEGVLEQFHVNDLDVLSLKEKYRAYQGSDLLPRLVARSSTREYDLLSGASEKLLQDAAEELRLCFHRKASPHTRMQTVSRLGIGSDEAMLKNIRTARQSKIWQQHTSALTTQQATFRRVRDIVVANAIPSLLSILNEHLNACLDNVRYTAPIRATTERYYRSQELGVDEVDPQGSNIAMFLKSLSPSELNRFQGWIKRGLGFSVRAKSVGGHTSLRVKETGSEREHNLADLGFGFSQILPVATQLWTAIYRRKTAIYLRRNSPAIRSRLLMLAIEQPELHLHPAFQSRLADLLLDLVAEARKRDIDIRLLVETHSETIINRIGSRIANDTSPTNPEAETPDDPCAAPLSSDIQIVLFQSEPEGTNVSLSTYDEQGFLTNWPYGFFEPEV